MAQPPLLAPTRRPRLAITLGDPCGIGPELLLSTLASVQVWADVTVIGARAGIELLAQAPCVPKVPWDWCSPPAESSLPSGAVESHLLRTSPPSGPGGQALWLDPTPEITAAQLHLGQASAFSGRCAVEAVRLGAERVSGGQADALVTLPLAKSAAHMAGYPIPGHTEFLQALAGSPISRMAFVSPSLSVVLHTVHQSLRSVIEGLSARGVAETLIFATERFAQLTGKQDLRVGLCALNPHAGENGAFGQEETLLEAALDQARAAYASSGTSRPFAHVPSPFDQTPVPEGRSAAPRFFGPLPSDTLFLRACRGEFDLVIALYHDQGLIPIKVLEPDRAVNLTLGLPYIRTSPDHGTAFDRAGTWTSSSVNFMEAAALAVRLAGRARQEPWEAQVPSGTPAR